ncbi:hypothetical protein NQ318_011316, partial [Aromia moschata]
MTGPKCIVAFCKNRRGETKNIAYCRLTAERSDGCTLQGGGIDLDISQPSTSFVTKVSKEFRSNESTLDVGTACLDICQPSTSHTPMFSEAHQEKPNESISNVDDEDDPPLTLNIFPPLTLPLNILFVEHRTTPCRFLELLPRVRNLEMP